MLHYAGFGGAFENAFGFPNMQEYAGYIVQNRSPRPAMLWQSQRSLKQRQTAKCIKIANV